MRFTWPFCLASYALAAEPLAPIDLAFSEVLSPPMQQQLEECLRVPFEQQGYVFLASDATKQQLTEARVPPRCVSGPCLREVGKALGTRLVLVGGVSGEGTAFDLSLTVLETQWGETVAQGTDRCDVCTFAEVKATLGRLAERVAKKLAALPPPTLAPAKAPVLTFAPPKPAVLQLPPPVVEAGATAPVLWPGWKWVALAAGVAGVSTGLFLLALDSDCVDSACDEQYDTATAGIVVTMTGSALLGGAALLYLF